MTTPYFQFKSTDKDFIKYTIYHTLFKQINYIVQVSHIMAFPCKSKTVPIYELFLTVVAKHVIKIPSCSVKEWNVKENYLIFCREK